MIANKPHDIWKFINRGPSDMCWLYTGGTFSGRYGRFWLKGKPLLAHRHVYELMHKPIPEGLFVMHKCNNKLCCNPSHLTVGTNRENQLHAVASQAPKLGKSGIRGVHYLSKRGYWRAQAYDHGKAKNLYTGPHKDKAIEARKRWEIENLINFETKGENYETV